MSRKIFEGVHTYKFDVDRFTKEYNDKDSGLKQRVDFMLHEAAGPNEDWEYYAVPGGVNVSDERIELWINIPEDKVEKVGSFSIVGAAEVDSYNGDVNVENYIANASPSKPQPKLPELDRFSAKELYSFAKPYVIKVTRPNRAERKAAERKAAAEAAAGAPQEGQARRKKTKRSSKKKHTTRRR